MDDAVKNPRPQIPERSSNTTPQIEVNNKQTLPPPPPGDEAIKGKFKYNYSFPTLLYPPYI